MSKRIFEEQTVSVEPQLQPKQEFTQADIIPDEEVKDVEAELIIEQSLKPSRLWIRLLLVALGLLGVAVIAQSLEWLIDTWQNHQWIHFVFAIGFLLLSFVGVGVILTEWRKLHLLRKHTLSQQQSEKIILDPMTSGEKTVNFCNGLLNEMTLTPLIEQGKKRWQTQLDEAYNSQEVLYLFNQNVLLPIDAQVKRLISKSATENAVIVAISPLAIVDVLMVGWRNIALINKITKAYGMELGYISRLKLFKLVLTNMVFAGATEVVTDMGSEFFSQNLTAKLSMRVAQGMGVGLLTARLGIKAMEFCRPVVFQANERPTLSVVRQEVLSHLKTVLFSKTDEKEREKV